MSEFADKLAEIVAEAASELGDEIRAKKVVAAQKAALTDLRQRVLKKEQVPLEEIRTAVQILREGRESAKNVKVAKAKKKADKVASGGYVDVDKIFSTEPSDAK